MRKKLSIGFLAVLLVGLLAVGAACAETMYVDTENHKSVNMRGGPSMYDDIITAVGYGKAVDVDEWLYGSAWVRCSYNGYYGYINSRYLSMYPPTPTARPTARPTTRPTSAPWDPSIYNGFSSDYHVALVRPSTPSGFVHMRWAPSKSAPIFSDYMANDTLYVLYSNDSWCQVYDPNSRVFGYMMKAFLNYVSVWDGGDGIVGPGGDGIGNGASIDNGVSIGNGVDVENDS